jgi:hypothetical protein
MDGVTRRDKCAFTLLRGGLAVSFCVCQDHQALKSGLCRQPTSTTSVSRTNKCRP